MVLLLSYTSVKPCGQKKKTKESTSFWRNRQLLFCSDYYILCQAALFNHNIFRKKRK